MAKDALQPLGGWRNELCAIPFHFPGRDISASAVRAQVRMAPGTPGLPLLDIGLTADPAALGIRMLPNTVDAFGIVTSHFVLQIPKAQLQGLPYFGELGTPSVFSYALQIDGVTRLYGPFGVLDSSIDSDPAPEKRPMSYGTGFAGGATTSVVCTIGDAGVTVTMDGGDYLTKLLAQVTASINATAAAAKTQSDAALVTAKTQSDAALVTAKAQSDAALAAIKVMGDQITALAAQTGQQAANVGASAASAARSAQVATAGAQTADTARIAVQQAIGQLPANPVLAMPAATRDILRLFTNMAAGTQAQLGETGRSGLFVWRAGDYSTQIAADPYEGLYVKANAVPAAQGAWCRSIPLAGLPGGGEYSAGWWDPQALGSNANLAIDSALGLIPDGATIVLPSSTTPYDCNGAIAQLTTKAFHFRMYGATLRNAPGRKDSQPVMFLLNSNTTLFGGTILGRRTLESDNEGASTPSGLYVASYINGDGTPRVTENILIRDLTIIASLPTVGVGSYYSLNGVNTGNPVRNVRYENCYFMFDYSGTNLPLVDDFTFVDCTWRADGYQAVIFSQCLRIYGSRNITLINPVFRGTGTEGINQALILASELNFNGGAFKRPNGDITVINPTGSNFNIAFKINDCSGTFRVRGGRVGDGPNGVAAATGVWIESIAARPVFHVDIEGVTFDGLYVRAINTPNDIAAAGMRTFRFNRNTIIGNKCRNQTAFSGGNFNMAYNSAVYTEIIGNRFVMSKDVTSSPGLAVLGVYGTGSVAIFQGNTLAENDSYAFIFGNGGGKIVTALGQAPQNASLGNQIAPGNNDSGPLGTWTATYGS